VAAKIFVFKSPHSITLSGWKFHSRLLCGGSEHSSWKATHLEDASIIIIIKIYVEIIVLEILLQKFAAGVHTSLNLSNNARLLSLLFLQRQNEFVIFRTATFDHLIHLSLSKGKFREDLFDLVRKEKEKLHLLAENEEFKLDLVILLFIYN
jgi:hypothetical protein